MTAATVCLMATGCVPAMCAAILITGGYRTFARCVSAFFVRFCVVHFFSSLSIEWEFVYPMETSVGQQKLTVFSSAQPRSHFRSVEWAGKCNDFGTHLFVS